MLPRPNGPRMPGYGQMYGPRHSSPNSPFQNNSPRPPNIGQIQNYGNVPPPGPPPGPQMRLFTPACAAAPITVPWGSGALPGAAFPLPPAVCLQPGQPVPPPNFSANQMPPGHQFHQSTVSNSSSNPSREHQNVPVSHTHRGQSRGKDRDNSDTRSSHRQGLDRGKLESGRREGGRTDRISSKSDRDSERYRERDYDRRSRPRHSGAILREDRDEERVERSERGAVLREDRDQKSDDLDEIDFDRSSESRYSDDKRDKYDSRGDLSGSRRAHSDSGSYDDRGPPKHGGAILIEDREFTPPVREDSHSREFSHSRKVRDESRSRSSSRTGALLLEDRDDSNDIHRTTRYRDDRERGRGHTDRGRGHSDRQRNNHSDNGHGFRERGRGNNGYNNRGRGHFSDKGERGRGNSDINNSGRGYPGGARTGRTGALLIDDRDLDRPVLREDRVGPVLRDDRGGPIIRDDRVAVGNIGRTGAILKEDRESSSVRGRQGHWGQTGRGEGQRSRTDDRSQRDRSSQRSSGRSDSVQRSKRSRSPSAQGDRRGHSVSKDRDAEPKYKRRKTRGTSEEKQMQCVRSGTPPVQDNTEDSYVEPVSAWVRCSAADLYFTKDPKTGNMVTTKRMQDLESKFEHDIVQRAARMKATQEPFVMPERPQVKWNERKACPRHQHGKCLSSDDSSSSSSSDSESEEEEELMMEELKRKQQHPYRLHPEIWFNDPGELNYGPLCRCSIKSRKSGIRHDKYPGEKSIPLCDINSNNLDKLFHYKITISPVTNFLTKHPTVVMFDGHEYMFEGFSIYTHMKIPKLPPCQLIRFNIIYTIHIIEEQAPENFSIRSLDLLTQFLFDEILELVDIDWKGAGGEGNCRRSHVMPRFARPFPENGKEILSMNDVLLYLLKSSKHLLEPKELSNLVKLETDDWQKFVNGFRHMVVTCPGKKPSSIRIDQLDKNHCGKEGTADKPVYPLIIHHGLRPPQLSYAGDPVYKKKFREYMKFRHLLWSRTKVTMEDKAKLEELEVDLQTIRLNCTMKREVTAEIDSEGFLLTGIRADICQHAMLLPVLFGHVRFHDCLEELQKTIDYEFKDRSILQLSMTHSSYRVNYGTNPDHGRNSLSNCGFRQLEFGDHRIHIQHTRKRGLNILLRIMSKMANKNEARSDIPHNERLEFLGDAVVEFITSTHLFSMFPYADEGELTTYRGSLVQNAHLSILADKLRLQDYLLYAHGPDLCHDSDLRHAMANCFEALMGALFLDGGIELADRVFSRTLFEEADLLDTWNNVPQHPLKIDEPNGDRHWIQNSPTLQKLVKFEDEIGYEFIHVRLLARAFTQRNVGYNHLTLGHNQRLEFLGDTIMQLISSNFLFRHFPDHHEGHLTLLRSSLVNNKTQARVAEELGMMDYVINSQKKDWFSSSELKQKEKADLLESLLGALFIDGGLEPPRVLCNVCFFPRLEVFIMNQDWNDPKSQLQQCCLTLRDINDESPDIPIYKVLSKAGPTNTRRYKVGVYFRGKRLAIGEGSSIQQGEMKAAEIALEETKGVLFPNRLSSQTWPLQLKQHNKKKKQDNVKAREGSQSKNLNQTSQ